MLLAAGGGCGRKAALRHEFDSIEAVARAVLEGLAARDEARLRELPLSREEFEGAVWPELPSNNGHIPLAYVWGDLHQKSLASLGATLAAHGGRRYRLVRVAFAGEATAYRSTVVHRRARVLVRDEEGRERWLALFGSILQRDRRYKLFSFAVQR